jgi:hypothetical protein
VWGTPPWCRDGDRALQQAGAWICRALRLGVPRENVAEALREMAGRVERAEWPNRSGELEA